MTTITSSADSGRGCQFKDITCDTGVGAAAQLLLQALALLPDTALTQEGVIDTTYGGDYFYANNAQAERWLIRGGGWNYGSLAGVFNASLNNPRSGSGSYIGGRSALIE